MERLIQIEESSGRTEEAGIHLLQIAKIKEKTGRLDIAISMSEKILTLDRFSAEATRKPRSVYLRLLNRNEEAYQHQLALGELLREKDQLKEAIDRFSRSHQNLA